MSKKVINGKLYNTDTAKECGDYWNGYSPRDFSYFRETLYLKKTGEFFLFGCGGAMSKYSQSCADGRCGGVKFFPLTESEAKKWAEDHLDADEYVAIFGEVEE